MPRGGRRAPKPGAAYSNRTDLNQRATPASQLPATAATGQPYGQAGQQLAAQKAVPMGTPPVPPPSAPGQPDTGAPPAPQYATPDDVMSLSAPTTRPSEPLTHGLPVGAGAGPEALTNFNQPLSPLVQGVAILNSLGNHLPPELQAVAKYLNVLQNNGQGQ